MHQVFCNCSKCNYVRLSEFISDKYKKQKQEELSKRTTDKNKDGK